jgi:hypothetical protein
VTSHHRCYRLVTVVTGDNVMSPTSVGTKGHNNDRRFGDVTQEPL